MKVMIIIAVIILAFPAIALLGFLMLYAGRLLNYLSKKVIHVGLWPLKFLFGDYR